MGAIQAKLINRERSDGDNTREYHHTWEVIVDSQSGDDESTALTHANIPVLGQRHPTDTAAFVTSRRSSLRTERSWRIYTVDINYAIVAGQEDAVTRDPTQPPDLWPPEVRIRSAPYHRVVTRDLNGDCITNAAGANIPQDQRTIEDFYAIIWFRRWFNISAFDPIGAVFQWVGKLNDDTWLNADILPGMARIIDLSSEPVYYSNTLYFRADFEIAIRTDDADGDPSQTWWLKYPNVGTHVKGGFGGLTPIMLPQLNEFGENKGIFTWTGESVPLTVDGRSAILDGTDPNIISRPVFQSITFADIGL